MNFRTIKTAKRTFLLTVIILLSAIISQAQITSVQIDSLVNDAMNKFDVVGAAVGVIKDGKIVHLKGYGLKTSGTNGKVDEFTDFAIASNSKAFTTTALAILVEQGKLKWTDRVRDYIPEFRMYNDYVTENFNIQDLLTHRSGLGLGAGDLMIFPDGTDFTITDIASNFQYMKPQSAFRTKFDYDNLLYLVAGEIIARVSGMSWEEFVQKNIFDKLEMTHTTTSLTHMKTPDNLATPHSTASGEIKPLKQFDHMVNGAAGGIYSCVADLCKWMKMHLNNGRYGNNGENSLVTAANHYEMWTIHTVQPANSNPRYNSHFAGYGLGWMLTDVKGNLKVSHTGGLPGMLSQVTMIPDLNLGVVVLTNTDNGGAFLFSTVTNTIIDSYLGLDSYDWTAPYFSYFQSVNSVNDSVSAKVWEIAKPAAESSIDINNYTGVYRDKWFGKMEVYKDGDKLIIRSYRSPKLTGEMFHYKANTFAIKWDYRDMNADAFAMFCLDETGKAKSFKMKGISPNIDFSFDFQDLELVKTDE